MRLLLFEIQHTTEHPSNVLRNAVKAENVLIGPPAEFQYAGSSILVVMRWKQLLKRDVELSSSLSNVSNATLSSSSERRRKRWTVKEVNRLAAPRRYSKTLVLPPQRMARNLS
jgi:hypothetical protein